MTTRQRILALLASYSATTADTLAGAAAHEARRLNRGGATQGEDLAPACREDLRRLLGRPPTQRQRSVVRQLVELYQSAPAELAVATGFCR